MEEILKMYESSFSDSNILRAAAGTTGFRGGDSGHGGRTFIELEDLANTDIDFKVGKEIRDVVSGLTYEEPSVEGLILILQNYDGLFASALLMFAPYSP